jgi:hypothetical protein
MTVSLFRTHALFCCLLLVWQQSFAQDYPIAISRQLFHDQVDKVQQRIQALDGRSDDQLLLAGNDSLNHLLTIAATKSIDSLQRQIELNKDASNNQKVAYLRGLAEAIQEFYTGFKKRRLRLGAFPAMINAWQQAYLRDTRQQSLAPMMDTCSYEVGKLLLDGISFMNNPYMEDAVRQNRIRLAYEQPAKAMEVLSYMPYAAFADSLIRVAMKYNPTSVYIFAQATETTLGKRIHQMEDTAIQLLCTLALRNDGQMYLPFYDDLLSGRITTAHIDSTLGDSLAYYRLLVKTAIGYAGRARMGDTASVWKPMRDMLHTKANQPFVNRINGLHNAGEAVRFKCLAGMSAADLYYLIVHSEQEIYTSSYMYAYRAIWLRMPVPSADSLLSMVQYDHYKKFIAMAANYNTLDHFLSKMSEARAHELMTSFVSDLDRGGDDDLEDAVDVANSYASIKNDTLRHMLLQQIRVIRAASTQATKARAATIYRLEDIILSSSEPGSDINLPDSLGIPPIYEVPYSSMLTDTGRVVVQVFFYDDFAVAGMFNGFLRSFNPKLWRISANPQWVVIRSLVGRPVFIYANKANTREDGTDERNQRALNSYLKSNNLQPTVTIHRGHSYTTRNTILQMSPLSKIVFLGSCGGYQLINEVLTNAPDAHIVASKQIGRTVINRPFVQLLTEKLRTGKNIQWTSFWSQLAKAAPYPGFEDYVPPQKNLGAILIKAYQNAVANSW